MTRISSGGVFRAQLFQSADQPLPLQARWIRSPMARSGKQPTVGDYTTLPAGRYAFRVQGATSRGVWSEPGLELAVEILLRGGIPGGSVPMRSRFPGSALGSVSSPYPQVRRQERKLRDVIETMPTLPGLLCRWLRGLR